MARSPADALRLDHPVTLAGVADSAEGLIAADLARAVAAKAGAAPTSLLVVCRDGQRLAQLARGLTFFAPHAAVAQFPAWAGPATSCRRTRPSSPSPRSRSAASRAQPVPIGPRCCSRP